MSLSAARPLNPWRWLALPALICIGVTMLFAAPFRVFGLQLPEPVFAMVPTFAWAVIRPSVLAPFGVLLLGLFLDSFWGGPMGLWGLSLLAAYATVLFMRNMMSGQSRSMMWAWFAGSTGIAMLAGFLFTMLDSLAIPSLVGVLWQFLATVLLFSFADYLVDQFEDADVRFR
jgi:rod shape-determining protein MreD